MTRLAGLFKSRNNSKGSTSTGANSGSREELLRSKAELISSFEKLSRDVVGLRHMLQHGSDVQEKINQVDGKRASLYLTLVDVCAKLGDQDDALDEFKSENAAFISTLPVNNKVI